MAVEERTDGVDRRVVDQDVDRPELGLRLLCGAINRAGIGDVHLVPDRSHPVLMGDVTSLVGSVRIESAPASARAAAMAAPIPRPHQ